MRVPHTRGDEPWFLVEAVRSAVAFPTPVGMNRISSGTQFLPECVPHTRGDEPDVVGKIDRLSESSPHPWG